MPDIYKTERRYEIDRKRIKEWPISKEDKETFLKFLDKRKGEGKSVVQLLKYVQSMATFVKYYDKPFKDLTAEDLDSFLDRMTDDNLSVKTKKIKWYSVKKFFEYIGKDTFKKYTIEFSLSKNDLPVILTEEEIERMINNCKTMRNRAMISVLYESGARIGELLNIRIKAVSFDEYGGMLLLNGKTGARRVRIMNSTILLQRWLENHPLKVPDSYVWITNRSNIKGEEWVRLSYPATAKILRDAARGAGVSKRVNPHIFRHTRATHLARYLTDSQLKAFFGWSQGSTITRTYIHLSGQDVDDAILLAYNKKRKESDGKIVPLKIGDVSDVAIAEPYDKVKKLEMLLISFFQVLSERDPKIKEQFREIVKQTGSEGLFK